MKICMVAYTFYEIDNRVKRYAEALAARGDHVDVVVLLNPLSEGESRKKFTVLNKVNVYRIQKRLINERNKFAYFFRIINFLVRSFFFLSMKYFKYRYNVIHVHSIPDFEVFAVLIPKIFHAKIILDIHDIVPEFYISKFGLNEKSFIFKLLIFLEKISCLFSDHIIIANDLWVEKLTQRSVKKEKCSVYLNYPDLNIFYKRDKIKKKTEKNIAVYPGSINWHQGLDVAIKAIGLIKEKIQNFEFHIYGDGPEKNNLINMVYELKIDNIVKFFGYKPLEEIAEIVSQADLGIVPKRKDSFGNEAFSTKIFELMALGIPVIASDTKIDKFYFNNNVIEFFESGNYMDLAKKIKFIIENKKRKEDIINNSLNFIKKFDWEFHKTRYFNLVDTL